MTDEMLMKMVAEGDLEQMTALFDKYHLYLYNFFLKKGHDATTAEDLTQNVFERILKYRATYKDSMPFKVWLFKIARNVASDLIRKTKISLDASVEVNELKLMTDNVLDEIEKKEQYSKLDQAIAKLDQEERELLHFSKFQKMRYAEISKVMKMPESTVRVKVHRALKKLRSHYQKLEVL